MDFPALNGMAFTVEGCAVNRIKIKLPSFIFSSCFEIIFSFVTLNTDLRGEEDQNIHVENSVTNTKTSVCI